jgi:putative spermidine/putrescine transport system substrate-binding protein
MKKWHPAAAVAAASVAIAASFGYLWMTKRGPELTIATWSGTYGRAQTTAQVLPFARVTGARVRIANYDGGTAELARQVAAKQYAWDVIDFELPDAVAACRQGLLEPIDAAKLPAAPDGAPAAEDFAPGAIGPCWVASVIYSQVVAYDPRRFAGAAPSSLADFFDVAKFPGLRAMSRTSGKLNLEMALLADGVAPQDVYALLSTPQGVARALAKLDTIRGSLVWWTADDPPARMLAEGRAVFATILNGEVFDAATNGQRLGVIWDRQLYQFEAFGIPKGNPRRSLAMDFIRFATLAEHMAGVADWVPYGPARRSAVALVGTNPELKIAMTPYLPTAHFETAFAVDDEWWRLHGADVETLWKTWIAGRS